MMQFEAQEIEVGGQGVAYAVIGGERWWTLRDLNHAGLPLRTGTFDDDDKLDVRPVMIRESALRAWGEATRSPKGAELVALLDEADEALADGVEEVAIEGVRTRASRIRRVPQAASVPDEGPQVGYTTIEWERFAYRGEGASGISLRALVEAGLYSHYKGAVAALERSGLSFAEISASARGRDGRPSTDHILDLRDAQRLCMRARTDVGERIADVILDHHDDFQRLLAGDPEVKARVEEHQEATAPPIDDPILAQLDALARMRREALEREARLKTVETDVGALKQEMVARLADRENRAAAPAPSVPVVELPKRAQINRLVRGWGHEHGGDYQEAYRRLYQEYRDRYHIDLKARAEHAGVGVGPLDVAEQLGKLEEVYAVAYDLYRPRVEGGSE